MSIANDIASEREAETEPEPTSKALRVEVTITKRMLVDLDPTDEGDRYLLDPDVDTSDLADSLSRWQRIAERGGSAHAHYDYDLEVRDATKDSLAMTFGPVPIDGHARESYLWTARNRVADARYQLSLGRYREGDCVELDEVNRELDRFEERLRVMALAAEGRGPDGLPLVAEEAS